MILERKPIPEDLIESRLVKSEMALAKRRSKVIDKISVKKEAGHSLKSIPEKYQRKAKSTRGVSTNVTINLMQPPSQKHQDNHIPGGASEAKRQRHRSFKDDPPNPSNEIIPSHSPRRAYCGN